MYKRQVRELSEDYGLAVDPKAVVGEISVGLQQRVEILKTLYRGAEILILDEPTAVLTPQETEELFAVIRRICLLYTSMADTQAFHYACGNDFVKRLLMERIGTALYKACLLYTSRCV